MKFLILNIILFSFSLFSYSQIGHYFRFEDDNQHVEIFSKHDSIIGRIINSIEVTHNKRSKKNYTLSDTTYISKGLVQHLQKFIWQDKFVNLNSSNKIENWQSFIHGTYYNLYFILNSDTSFKSFSNPESQKNITEAKTATLLVKRLKDTLKLKARGDSFYNQIDLKPNYSYSRGYMKTIAVRYKRIGLGYFGTSRVPTGYYISYWVPPILKRNIITMISLQHLIGQKRVEFSRNYDFNFKIGKSGLITKNLNESSDNLRFNFRRRFFDFISNNVFYTNYKLRYRFPVSKNTSFGAGVDYLLHNSNDFGVIVYAGHDFFKEQLWIDAQTSIFKEEVDYKISAYYTLHIKKVLRKKRRIHLNTGVENFRNYIDVFLGIKFYP